MSAQGGGPPAGGFDYNSWAAMNLGRGGGGPGEAVTPDTITQKGIDKYVQAIGKVFGVNTDIEGKSALSGFETDNIGSGFSLSHGALMKEQQGGILASILKYFTRELPPGLTEGSGGDGGGADGGGGSGGGDFASGSGSGGGDFSDNNMAGQGNFMPGGGFSGGDMPSFAGGGAMDAADAQVNYGGKMVSAEALVADLGNLRPSATPASDGQTRGGGVEM